MRGYASEFSRNWRALVAAVIGLGSGIGVNAYVASLFAPELIREFGWSKADFAYTGATSLVAMLAAPMMGRITDAIGTRRMAAIGIVGLPICYLAHTLMSGSLWQYLALLIVMHFVSMATSSLVYTRLVAACFSRGRGLALAIAASGAPLGGAIMSMVLVGIIDAYGWRAGYYTLAAVAAGVGLVVLLLMPPDANRPAPSAGGKGGLADYARCARTPAFWLIIGGMLLCNLNQPLHAPQLKMVLLDSGADSRTAGTIVSIYALGVLAGRFVCGVALDRLPAHWVAATMLGLPAIGFFILASNVTGVFALGGAVVLMALSQGAEGDVAAYMVARHFGVDAYSSVLGLVFSSVAIGSALGSLILGLSLQWFDSFAPFQLLSAAASLSGCFMFVGLRGRSSQGDDTLENSEVSQPVSI